jgi:hypothetical protein
MERKILRLRAICAYCMSKILPAIISTDVMRQLPLLASCSLPSTRAKCEIDAIRDLSARK